MEHGYSDSSSSLSEAPDIRNWFSSYVYESLPINSLANESEIQVDGFDVREPDKHNLGVAVSESKPPENNKPRNESMKLFESLPSEPPDIGNWFSSYVYESPILDTSDGLELSVPVESECVKETETDNERNIVCPRLSEQEFVSSANATDFSQFQSLLSEPPDLRNWFSSYEYQSPQLSDSLQPDFSTSERDQLIIDESDTEEETSTCIFRKTKSRKDTTISPGSSTLKDNKDIISADTAKEVSAESAYSDQEIEKMPSVGLFDAVTKEVKQQSSFKQEPLLCEPKEKPQSPFKNESSSHELRPKQLQETISMNSSRPKSPTKIAQKACAEGNLESTDQESNDKENDPGKSTETGFVSTKKARFREARDQCSMTKPTKRVLVECSNITELKKIAKDEQDEETSRRKKRRVLREMSNDQLPGAEEIVGKWLCPQKNKGKIVPPLKQLRLDAWIHKV